jgi:HEAT repeat protein
MTRIGGLSQVINLGPRAVEVADDIVPMLGDADPAMRARALSALGRTGPEHARAIVPLLSDPALRVKVEAACALVATPYAGMTPALLADQLAQRDETIRGRAAECLGDLGPRAAASVPALMAAVSNIRGGAYARYHATAALGRIGPAASQSIPVLESASADPERYVRQAAVVALRRVKGESSRAAPGGAPGLTASPGP